MAKFKIAKGTRDRSFPVYAWNSGTGAPFGSLFFNTVGFSGEYRREYQSTWQNISLASGVLGSYVSGGFVADGSLPGRFQFSPPNEVFATGNDRWAQLCLYGPANLLPILCEVELDELDYQNRQNLGVVNISGAPQVTQPIHVAVTGYAVGFSPSEQVLITSGNKLKTSSLGFTSLDLTQLVPTSNTNQTVGDALNAARANGFGKWVLNTGTVPPTLDIYASNGSTVIKQFTLDSISSPTTRS